MKTLRTTWRRLPRGVVVLLTALVIYVPLSFIIIQSFLSAPFFSPSKVFSLGAFRFIFTDPDFYKALRNGFILAFGLVAIAIPLGGILAFLMIRTDLPGRRFIEPLILVPVFVSPMVLAFGYVVAAGPVGFFSLWAQSLVGFIPWDIYAMSSIVVIAGLTHVPHAYLYISSALRSVGSDVEEAARTVGATPLQVMLSVSLPMVRPAILYACVLLFFLGLEVFGLMLVLGDPEGNLVLATYLFQLTNKLGTPSYHLMAAVAVVLICLTVPLVMLQRRLMRTANRFVTVKGKAAQARLLPLGKWRWVAGVVVVAWLTVTIGVPLAGVMLRAFITNWGVGVDIWAQLSLKTFRLILGQTNLMRAIVNSISIGVIGGAIAVMCYLFIGLALHRKPDGVTRFMDYSVLVPRAVPGLLAGLAFLWVFLFIPMWLDRSLKDGLLSALPFADGLREHFIVWLRSLRNTIFSVWLAYTVVWMAYGLRLISSTLLQVGPELEEAARSTGASQGQVTRHVTIPLSRYGLIGSWLLMFLIFEREYSTGVYLLSPGTETIGSMLVSLWAAGAIDIVAALSFINILIVVLGLGVALRFGVKMYD
ncbi:ABC transporter permease [Sodalis sp. C49]|uniref:ABC transporter permease n=1 Tax=unclassified Sodalis (in: enterobacteria) TaxID=2636512 RepID=UPI0039659BFB